jgi:hypothetical protein
VEKDKKMNLTWKHFAPVVVAIIIALLPAPEGLPQHAWYFFAIFAGVIVGLMFEPLPGGAVGLIGVTLVTLLARWVLYGPADLAKPGFNPTNASLTWALSGFSNSTVWLILVPSVRARLRKDRARPTHRLGAGAGDGAKDAHSRLCGDDRRYDPGALYAVEYSAQRRHHLSGNPQSSAPV